MNKNSMKNFKLNSNDIALEISTALKEMYNGEVSCKDDLLVVKFENGQSFNVEVKENC